MRRFISYFNALLLGVILGMIFVATVNAVPLEGNLAPAGCGELGPVWAFIVKAQKQILHSPPPNLPQRADALRGPWYVRGARSFRMTPLTVIGNFRL
jgi:hypothetical protein